MKGKPYWLLTLIFLVMILIGTLSPRDIIVTPDLGSDKNYHFLAFALLVMPLTFENLKNAYWLLPLAVVFGAIIELLQPHLGRHGELNDLYADAFGALIGVILVALVKLAKNS
mgnify:FL=1